MYGDVKGIGKAVRSFDQLCKPWIGLSWGRGEGYLEAAPASLGVRVGEA
jgi:hypothetical protein